jgi:hypothetical protein
MARNKDLVLAIALPVVAVLLFSFECFIFGFSGGVVLDAISILLMIAFGVALLAPYREKLNVRDNEVVAIGAAIGVTFFVWLDFAFASIFNSDRMPLVGIISIWVGMGLTMYAKRDKYRYAIESSSVKTYAQCLIGVLILFALYNLLQFHFGANRSIITRNLFGVDLPFLAGDIHGIRNFGSLRDLHQLAQPWHYHDAIYQLLSLLPQSRVLEDVAFAAPVIGYSLLAFAVFTLVNRFTASRYVAWISVVCWFFVNGLATGEMGSYALSPSFVFGSLIFVAILLVLDIRLKEVRRKQQIILSIILLYLLVELSQTKLSQFLVLDIGLSMVALWSLRKQRRLALELILLAALPLALVLFQSAGPNPLMPGDDFLIGAPLLGYANHLASALHTSVAAVNPVSHGLHLKPQGLLIIPFFVFHFLRLVVMEPKILAAIIVLFALRSFYVKSELVSTPLSRLLVILIPLGFFLPVLYSPAWYPLALSFYAPLVSVQAAMLVVAMAWPQLANSPKRNQKAALGIAAIVLLFGFALGARTILKEDSSKPQVVSASLVSVMSYLTDRSNRTDILLSRRYNLDSADESFYWYSALSGRTVVSEGAKYGSLLGAVADTDSEKGLHPVLAAQKLLASRRALIDTVFLSTDSSQVRRALAQTKAAYVLEDTAKGQYLASNPQFYADKVHSEGSYTLWKVR